MREKEYSLIDIIRDPGLWVYEAFELDSHGHYYLYRYDAGEATFSRATVPAGAAGLHFHLLKAQDRVPIGGWLPLERKWLPFLRPRLVVDRKSASA
jgi:hypothetical protein